MGYQYVTEPPYEAVMIGSLRLSELLRFREERVLAALAEGKPVYLYTPGLPEAPKNRALAGSLTAAQRELKNWGVLFLFDIICVQGSQFAGEQQIAASEREYI